MIEYFLNTENLIIKEYLMGQKQRFKWTAGSEGTIQTGYHLHSKTKSGKVYTKTSRLGAKTEGVLLICYCLCCSQISHITFAIMKKA
jgi:hypothetical protein